MGMAVVDFQRTGDHTFFPQRYYQHGVYFRRAMCFIIVLDDDFSVIYRLLGGRANEIIVIAVVQFAHADIGQNVLGIGDRDGICMNIMANNLAHLA